MIICLYGPDSLRRRRKLQALLSQYRERAKESDLFFADVGEDPDSWRAVRDFLLQPSLFDVAKVAVIRDGGTCKEKEWIRLLKDEIETKRHFLILSDSNAPRAALRFLLELPVRAQEFAELEGTSLSRFVRAEYAARGVRIAPELEEALLRSLIRTQDRSMRAVQVLDQLAFWVKAGHAPSACVLAELLHVPDRGEMFRIVRELAAASRLGERLLFLERALVSGDPSYAFNSLVFQVRGGALRVLGEYDVSIKSGGLEYEEALADFALRGAF